LTDQAIAPAGEGAPAPVSTPAETAQPASYTRSELGRMLGALRRQPAESAEPAPADDNEIPAQAENAAPPEEAPGEAPEAIEPAAEPPIEPPRSWTKEAKEQWQSLPRNTQEYLAQREQERDRELRQRQNEAADKLKGLTAKEQAAEQARQQYEAALPTLMQTLQDAQAGTFSDIRTVDDVTKLAAEDPFRYLQWQAHQTKMQAVQAEMRNAQERQSQERQNKWAEEVREYDRQFVESLTAADKAKYEDFKKEAPSFLEAKGFKQQELAEYAAGKPLSIYHPAVQSLILDGLKYQAAQKAKATVTEKPVPPVQRPGAAKPAGEAGSDAIRNLSAQLERTGKTRDLANLIGAMRGA
jgi:hypothetical protein